jgi:hypothetical protein
MEQMRAVGKMMVDIKLEGMLPEEYLPFIRKRLELMWVVGYEAKFREYPNMKAQKPVRVLDKQGELIKEFDCTKSAASFLDIPHNTAKSAVRIGNLVKSQYYIRYI